MALDTTIVPMGSELAPKEQGFSPIAYGQEQFPGIRDYVVANAVDAAALSDAIDEDKQAAAERYGVSSGIGAVIPVRFTGVVGERKSGVVTVDVEGLPADRTVRVQIGPAVIGTDLRDATGEISFGQFTNQIEYQDAASGINEAMKAEVFQGLDRESLSGERISVVGVFRLVNPDNWLVTPVALEVGQP
jgi:predicted lipoprotein